MSNLVPPPLAGELAPELERARAYAAEDLAANTRAAHTRDWSAFVRWCEGRALSPLDCDDPGLGVYLAWMADQGYAPGSIAHAYAGIAARLRDLGRWPTGPRPTACRKVLRGIFRTSPHRTIGKRAATAREVQLLLTHCGGGVVGVRNRALLLLGFVAALRRSELVALNVGDVAFERWGMRVTVRRGKTDQLGKGYVKGILAAAGEVCAVSALRSWLVVERWPGAEQPLFCALRKGGALLGRRLRPRAVADIVKAACEGAGLPAADFAGHSLRAGFVTTAAGKHKSLKSIMDQTGHRTVAQVLEYIRFATLDEENASEGIFD